MDGPDGIQNLSNMNGPFRDSRWTDPFRRTDCSTIEPMVDGSIVDEPRVDGPKGHVALN